jgi:hypothetical protein
MTQLQLSANFGQHNSPRNRVPILIFRLIGTVYRHLLTTCSHTKADETKSCQLKRNANAMEKAEKNPGIATNSPIVQAQHPRKLQTRFVFSHQRGFAPVTPRETPGAASP